MEFNVQQILFQDYQDFVRCLRVQGEHIFLITQSNQFIQYKDNQLIKKQLFPNLLYSILPFQDKLIFSQKKHPLQIYYNQKCIGQIKDKKPNSESYLVPLQLIKVMQDVFGCGKGFIRKYDINKQSIKSKFGIVKNKQYISCLSYNKSQKIIAAGHYDGQKPSIIDIIQADPQKKIAQLKVKYNDQCHLGGITHLQFYSQYYLFSGARKDSLLYQWDMRRMDNFIAYFVRNSFTNQRIQFHIYKDILYTGDSEGNIKSFDILSRDQRSLKISSSCINNVYCMDNRLVISSGNRRYFDYIGQNKKQVNFSCVLQIIN